MNKKPESLKLIKHIRDNYTEHAGKIFTCMDGEDRSFIDSLIMAGVDNMVMRPINQDKLAAGLKNAINMRNDKIPDKRKLTRVVPGLEEEANVVFRSALGKKIIKARIVNVSVGGVAVEIRDSLLAAEANVRDMLVNATIEFDNKKLLVDLLIIGKVNNYIGMKFVKPEKRVFTSLCDYIYNKIKI
jgi:hypothetical protein